jgi:transcriptional regulator with XRE-family HTH domain
VRGNPQSIFGAILLALRESEGWSQEGLAEACKLSRDYISRLERGLAMPSLKTIHRLARNLNLTGEELHHRFIVKLKNEGIYEQWISSAGR